jgi:hypothetical protein
MLETDVVKMQMQAQAQADAEAKRLPGYVPQGMEQSSGLADVLYSRWLEGLKGRWGMV